MTPGVPGKVGNARTNRAPTEGNKPRVTGVPTGKVGNARTNGARVTGTVP